MLLLYLGNNGDEQQKKSKLIKESDEFIVFAVPGGEIA